MDTRKIVMLGGACLFITLAAVALFLSTRNSEEVTTLASNTQTPASIDSNTNTVSGAPTTLSSQSQSVSNASESESQNQEPAASESNPEVDLVEGTAPNSRTVSVDIGGETRRVTLSNAGWIIPEEEGGIKFGADLDNLVPFVPANDGPNGVTIDASFLAEHAGAPWLSEENGVPLISNINADNVCLNILTTVILRDSFVNCPTRTQSGAWGYAGDTDNAPAVQVLGDAAAGSVVEYNTITCSGFDGDICSRSVRAGARDMTIRFNDLSFARGAVHMFHGTSFAFNYAHDFSFGFDPSRANSATDRITHNNATNDQGYSNTSVAGNYIDATYGRVSNQPTVNLNPHFRGLYENGVVEVGDPLNGFAFSHYLNNGSGHDSVWTRNYVNNSGRPFLCNSSARHGDAVCSTDISLNVFDNLRKADFANLESFEDADGQGAIAGRCNFQLAEGELSNLLFPGESQSNDCQSELDLTADDLMEFSSQFGRTPFSVAG